MATLRLTIDPSGAIRGAEDYQRALSGVKGAASDASRANEEMGREFNAATMQWEGSASGIAEANRGVADSFVATRGFSQQLNASLQLLSVVRLDSPVQAIERLVLLTPRLGSAFGRVAGEAVSLGATLGSLGLAAAFFLAAEAAASFFRTSEEESARLDMVKGRVEGMTSALRELEQVSREQATERALGPAPDVGDQFRQRELDALRSMRTELEGLVRAQGPRAAVPPGAARLIMPEAFPEGATDEQVADIIRRRDVAVPFNVGPSLDAQAMLRRLDEIIIGMQTTNLPAFFAARDFAIAGDPSADANEAFMLREFERRRDATRKNIAQDERVRIAQEAAVLPSERAAAVGGAGFGAGLEGLVFGGATLGDAAARAMMDTLRGLWHEAITVPFTKFVAEQLLAMFAALFAKQDAAALATAVASVSSGGTGTAAASSTFGGATQQVVIVSPPPDDDFRSSPRHAVRRLMRRAR